ncbi:MAG: hypothetical protein IPL39_10090 [Opitutaceae bacterium]|nr:hypothetical protein [Opitutaceae bacterium]
MTLLRVPPSVGATIAAFALTLAGCREQPVRTYNVAKDTPPPPTASADPHAGHDHAAGELPPGHPPIGGAAMAGPTAAPGSVSDSLTWAAPDHWAAKPLGAMRRGSFAPKNAAGEADCSIFVFPASSNPLRANLDRWRGQIGLARLTDEQFATAVTTLDSDGLSFATVDLLGKQPGVDQATRVLGAVLYRGEEAWFFKLTGPDAAVAAEKASFLDFLRTVRPTAP